MAGGGGGAEILATLGDFTSKENWDKFFSLRGSGDSFEWYAEWPDLRGPLLDRLRSLSSDAGDGKELELLVPGCGNSAVSERLYDAGFRRITNIDFSKVVVSDMLRRHVRSRPEMKWRVMDMTEMQFADESFDVILDKGGLDALMEPELGSKLGSKYVKEVKRVLKSGGNFLCLTLAESHVIELLFSEFRFGWETSIHAIPHKCGSKPTFQTFMVAVVKEMLDASKSIVSLFDHSNLDCDKNQVHALLNAVDNENKIRDGYSSRTDILYTLQDLQLGAKGTLKDLCPGRRFQLILGEKGDSRYSYKTVVLDAQQQCDPFLYQCAVLIIHKARAREWLFTSEEGQWLVVESSKAARLIMVFLDMGHSQASMDDIQKDLSPLVKNLTPGSLEDESKIPFMMANDGVKERHIVRQVTSEITGPIIVEDVIYEDPNGDNTSLSPSEIKMFRRLTFERNLGLVQSEALLKRESQCCSGEAEIKKSNSSSKFKKKGGKKKSDSHVSIDGYRNNLKVDHSCLASTYHSAIISGFALLVSVLETAASSGNKVKTYIIGLGAGCLPMFLHRCFPFLDIEVVELDPTIVDLAKKDFGFTEDKRLKVHIGDGIQFIQNLNNAGSSEAAVKYEEGDLDTNRREHNGKTKTNSFANGCTSHGIKLLIVDVDSSDLSSGLTCPAADFVEDSFLLLVRNFLSEGGLFIINLLSRSPAIREMIVSRLKAVFSQVFCFELEKDVNAVLFASPLERCTAVDHFPEAAARLKEMLKFPLPDLGEEMQGIKRL